MRKAWIPALGTMLIAAPALRAAEEPCDSTSRWDAGMSMCMPIAGESGTAAPTFTVRENLFGARIWQTGPRGQEAWAAPDMVMADLGTAVGRHFLNVDLMLTAERWTFPDRGYPLLLQIGETNPAGVPFIDAQHPHNSPIMGLTFSDTYSLGHEKDLVKLFFAPRGEATDGPIAFMHRETGMVNPDAPLGHHVGQDVGHITSTVIGAALELGSNRFEISGYHGAEPSPDAVDLPVGTPDSLSIRWINQLTPEISGMVSAARVNRPEPDQPDIPFEGRYSASAYWRHPLCPEWVFRNTLIYGAVTQYDHAPMLSSFTEEFLFQGSSPRIWGRMEILQRTANELAIAGTDTPDSGRWVAAFTLGYTHRIWAVERLEAGVGGSLTKDFLPEDFIGAYGGNPWAGKVFLQFSGLEIF